MYAYIGWGFLFQRMERKVSHAIFSGFWHGVRIQNILAP